MIDENTDPVEIVEWVPFKTVGCTCFQQSGVVGIANQAANRKKFNGTNLFLPIC